MARAGRPPTSPVTSTARGVDGATAPALPWTGPHATPDGVVTIALRLILLLLGLGVLSNTATARTLTVGPGQAYATPSLAARAAEDGDTVLIEPGEYFDCAVWNRHRMTIAGNGPGVVITDTTCQGKALFIVRGTDVTIRDLTLTRARVADGNGAGIRLEGEGLILERVRFVNNQVGLLSGFVGPGAIRILDCTFERGGRGGDHPLFAVWVWGAALLRIENSTFAGVMGGQISSGTRRTELIGNRIGTGTGEAPAVAVLATNTDLLIEDNVLSIGPNAPRLAAAVLVMGEGSVTLRRNRLVNDTRQPAAMLLHWTGTTPVAADNTVGRGDSVVSTSGVWRHRMSGVYHQSKDAILGTMRQVKRWVAP